MEKHEYAPIQMEIARQLHNAKPGHLEPGKHVGFAPVDGDAIDVEIRDEAGTALVRMVRVRYMAGPDLYRLTITEGGESSELDGVYCDQLGELTFGLDCVPWTEPLVTIYTAGPDGQLEIFEI